MGFDVSYIVDILKFPWPLFPKYKNNYPIGLRYDIPALYQDFVFEINLPAANKFELQSFAFSSTGYKDGDCYSLKKNDEYIFRKIFTKELGQIKEIRPVKKIESGIDKLTFVFHNETGTSKVIWIDLDLTVQRSVKIADVDAIEAGDAAVSPLAYFYAIQGQDGYVDPFSFATAYWDPNLEIDQVPIPTNFWEGREELLEVWGNHASQLGIWLNDYKRYQYKLVQDTLNGFTNPLMTGVPWTRFKNEAVLDWGQGGLGLSALSEKQLAEIYLSHIFRTPVNVFNSALQLLEGNRIDFIKSYLKINHMFVFDWIDFNDVKTDVNIGGFDFDPAGETTDPLKYRPLRTIKSYLNIEPQSFNLSTDNSRVCHPREYYFPEGSDSWLDAHYRYMDGVKDPLESYDLIISDATINTAEVFTREMGRAIDLYRRDKHGIMFSQQADWLSIAGWDPNYFELYQYGNSMILPISNYKSLLDGSIEPPVSAYGASHPMNDFAETYSLYCCNPRVLIEQFPLRWAFMEKYLRPMKP